MANDTEISGVAAAATATTNQATTDGSSVIVEQDPSAAPPDGRYGWVCVGCVFFLNACTWGIAATYGVFLSHYLTSDTHPTATPLDYAFIGGLQFGCALSLASPITIPIFSSVGAVHATRSTELPNDTRKLFQPQMMSIRG